MQKYNQYDTSLPHYQWWMALTMPQFITDPNFIHYLNLNLVSEDYGKEEWLDGFEESWGITDRPSWIEMISRLIKGEVHGDSLAYELELIHFIAPHQWQEYRNDIEDEKQQVECQFAEIVHYHCGLGGIRAWDYTRAGFLIRSAYHCDIISAEEACFLLNITAQQAQYYFKNWQQYLNSANLGRSYWVFGNQTRRAELGDWGEQLLDRGFDQKYEEFHRNLAPHQHYLDNLDWHTPLPELAMPASLSEFFNREDAA